MTEAATKQRQPSWSELSAIEQSFYHLPPGSKWFKNKGLQAPMLEYTT